MSSDRTCSSSSWTKEEEKKFETCIAIYSGDSDLFVKIAAALPQKSLQEIEQHYNDLVDDVNDIESGKVPLPQYPRMQSCPSRRNRLPGAVVERRRGIAWTAEEHRLFLQGLQKYGRGDWRGISRNCVRSRTPTQVASHAQKFFSRLNNANNGKRRRSIHDITSVKADTIGPSQEKISEKLIGPCGGHLQCPITDYVTDAFETGMSSLQGPATNCIPNAIEGASAVNAANFPFGAAVSGLNSPLSDEDDEFLQGIEDLITVPTVDTSEVWCEVDARTPPLLGLQSSIEGGTGTYTHPVNSVVDDLEDVITKQFAEATEIGPTINTARLPWSNADHFGYHGCPASSIGAKNGFEISAGAREGGFLVDSKALPSVPGTSHGVYPSLNATINAASKGIFSDDSRILPSIPGTSGEVYPGLNATINAAPEGGFSGDSRTLPSILGTSSGGYPSLNTTICAAAEGGFSGDFRTLPSILGTCGGGYPSLNATINAASERCFPGKSRTLPSIPGTSGGVYPSLNTTINAAPEGGFSGKSRTLPSIPGTSGGVYPSLNTTFNAAPEGGFSGDSRTLPSNLGTSGGVYPSLNATINATPEGGFSGNSRTLPSIPGTRDGVNPSLSATTKDGNISPWEGLFPGHIFTFDESESVYHIRKL